jgi:hypothetical protein
LDISTGEDEFQELDINVDRSWKWLIERFKDIKKGKDKCDIKLEIR